MPAFPVLEVADAARSAVAERARLTFTQGPLKPLSFDEVVTGVPSS